MKQGSTFLFVLLTLFLSLYCDTEKSEITQSEIHESNILGTILDEKTHLPIDSVRVRSIPMSIEVYTDTSGHFILSNIKQKSIQLLFSKLGYLDDSLEINLEHAQDTVVIVNLSHDPAFAQISLWTSKKYYKFNPDGATLIPYYFKNFTDTTAYYGKCGGRPVYLTCWLDSGDWKCSGSLSHFCFAIYLWEDIYLLPYTITYDTLYVTSKDTFKFKIEINHGSNPELLTSNIFIVE